MRTYLEHGKAHLGRSKNKKRRQEIRQTVYFGICAHSECVDRQWLRAEAAAERHGKRESSIDQKEPR